MCNSRRKGSSLTLLQGSGVLMGGNAKLLCNSDPPFRLIWTTSGIRKDGAQPCAGLPDSKSIAPLGSTFWLHVRIASYEQYIFPRRKCLIRLDCVPCLEGVWKDKKRKSPKMYSCDKPIIWIYDTVWTYQHQLPCLVVYIEPNIMNIVIDSHFHTSLHLSLTGEKIKERKKKKNRTQLNCDPVSFFHPQIYALFSLLFWTCWKKILNSTKAWRTRLDILFQSKFSLLIAALSKWYFKQLLFLHAFWKGNGINSNTERVDLFLSALLSTEVWGRGPQFL